MPAYEPDNGPLTDSQITQIKELVVESKVEPIPCNLCGTALAVVPGIGLFCPNKECGVIEEPVEETQLELNFNTPITFNELSQADIDKLDAGEPLDQWNKMIEAAEQAVAKEKTPEEILNEGLNKPTYQLLPKLQNIDELNSQVQEHEANVEAEKQLLRKLKADQLLDELKKKSSYIIKDQDQQIKKTKE